MLAHHYLSALELSPAPPARPSEPTSCEAQAIRYLALAGERALALDVDRAEQSLAQALELAPAGHPRARLAARALGAGGAAAGPAGGGEGRRSRRRSPSTASRARAWPRAAC